MKVLFWSFPWASQGNVQFYKNCLVNHLAIQASTLAEAGHEVEILIPEVFEIPALNVRPNLKVVALSQAEVVNVTSGRDMSAELYVQHRKSFLPTMAELLRSKLASHYDAILLWETPVPFLEEMFPDSLIVHQMPGAFSRAPYPATVVFDPVGLFKHGMLAKHANEILSQTPDASLTEALRQRVVRQLKDIAPFTRTMLDSSAKFKRLELLPLQVSAHYAFEADTGFASQSEFLNEVMIATPEDVGVVVTQYVHGHARDIAIDQNNLQSLQKKWPNLIYSPSFDDFPSISQYLLPFVTGVTTCSSSVGMQGLLWGHDLSVIRPTFLQPYGQSASHGLSGKEVADKLLGFSLSRHQPLMDKVLKDGVFLTTLLEAMLERKRSGLSGIDLSVDFSSIDPTYGRSYEKAISIGKAKRIIVRERPQVEARAQDAAKFARAAQADDIKVISFDVFDTLICRPVEAPADLYAFLEIAVIEELGGLADGFAKVRLNAEVTVRKGSDLGEITLDMIYDYIQKFYGISKEKTEKIKSIELDLEANAVRQRPFGHWLFDIAKQSGKRVVLISDMYLPYHALERMLENCGYGKESYESLFVSSDYGARKKEGELFDLVIPVIGVKPEEILHVGDNVVADIEQPRKRGMKAFRLVRALDRIRQNRLYYDLFNPRMGAGEIGRSVIVGTLAGKLFEGSPVDGWDNSLFAGDSYNLGYSALGPILLGYSLWLRRKANQDGISDLYFLSREGWILQRAYEIFFQSNPESPRAHYLMASRRASRVAAISNPEDVASVALQPYSPGVELGALLNSRFGLMADEIIEIKAQDVGYASLTDVLQADAPCRARFMQMCMSVTSQILLVAGQEREGYLAYLEKSGLYDAVKPAVVDIGWKANMQASLGNLVGRPVAGYYLATLEGAQTWVSRGHSISGYLGDFLSQSYQHGMLLNRHVCEFLFCASSKSLVSVSKSGTDFEFHFKDEANYVERSKFINRLHAGALDFCRDVNSSFSRYLDNIFVDPHTATKILQQFLMNPTKADAKILARFAFEDSFGGVSDKGVIAAERADSVWKPGFDVLSAATSEKKSPKVSTAKLAGSTGAGVSPDGAYGTGIGASVRHGKIETLMIKATCSSRLFNKYQRDRHAFFQDSRNFFLKTWYKLVG